MPPVPDGQAPLPAGPFLGREAFRAILRSVFGAAAREGWRELWLCDADYADWPLGERAVVTALTQWALGGGRLVMLAASYRQIVPLHPLWVHWRRQWAHRVHCHALNGGIAEDAPSLVWTPTWSLQRHNQRQSIGTCGPDGASAARRKGVLDELHADSTPAFPPDVLGL